MAEISEFTIENITEMITAIRGDNHNAKKYALSNLHTIAKVLGPQRTREELIPYTIEASDYDEEEYGKIAEEFGKMLQMIGGEDEISVLLQPLRFLCENEDNDVRNPAIDSIVSLIKGCSDSAKSKFFSPLIKSMATDSWYALRSSSACIICRSILLFNQPEQAVFSSLLLSLSSDSIVLVRKTLASQLPTFIFSLQGTTPSTNQKLVETLYQIITVFSKDEAAAVSIEIPSVLAAISSNYSIFSNSFSYILSTSELLLSGPWQTYASFLLSIPSIYNVFIKFDSGISESQLQQIRAFLKETIQNANLSDQREVKTAAARIIAFIWKSKCLSLDSFSSFVSTITSDHSEVVRKVGVESLGEMTPEAVPDAPRELLESTFSKLMGDLSLDVKIATLTSIAKTGAIATAKIGRSTSDLIKFTNWRTRKSICAALVLISQRLSAAEFDAGFLPLLSTLLSDEAADVRTEAIKIGKVLADNYGNDWKDTSLLPIIERLAGSKDYLLRQTAAVSIIKMGFSDQCQKLLNNLANDPVPNVRLTLARELPKDSPLLQSLLNDPDSDVSACANKH